MNAPRGSPVRGVVRSARGPWVTTGPVATVACERPFVFLLGIMNTTQPWSSNDHSAGTDHRMEESGAAKPLIECLHIVSQSSKGSPDV